MLDYPYYLSIKDELLDIYMKDGRKGVSDRLGINYNSTGHVLKYLGFYSGNIQDRKWEHRVNESRKPKHANPFVPFDKNSAYILGFIVGDGCLLSNHREYRTALDRCLDISCNDYNIIRDIAVKFGTSGIVGDGYMTKKVYENMNHHTTYSFRTEDYSCIESLVGFGLRERKSTKGCTLDFPKEFYSHFVRGLIDADGYVRLNKSKLGKVRVYLELCGHRSYLEQVVEETKDLFNWKWGRDRGYLSFICLYKQDDVFMLYKWLYNDAELKIYRKWRAFYDCFENGVYYEQYRKYSSDR